MRTANFRLQAAANNEPAEIFIYDDIGPAWLGMVAGQTVIDALAEIGPHPVNVRINSPGGDVMEAFAIYNALARHKPGVTVDIDSLAASAASVIAMAGKTIRIAENAMVMIHNVWTFAMGDAAELRQIAGVLDQVGENIVNTYAARTQQSAQQIQQWMDAETWMQAKEAVARGFADEIGQALQVSASVAAGRFKNTPAHYLQALSPAAPPTRAQHEQPAPRSPHNTIAAQKVALTRLRNRL